MAGSAPGQVENRLTEALGTRDSAPINRFVRCTHAGGFTISLDGYWVLLIMATRTTE